MLPNLDNDKGVCERVFFADFMRVNSPILDEERMDTIADSMDHPITDYWIASSHNTYLEGDQECDLMKPRSIFFGTTQKLSDTKVYFLG